jgi:hypothetical protein
MTKAWTVRDYDRLFRDDQPTQPHAPSNEALDEMAAEFGCSPKAVRAHWDDARSAILHNRTEASAQLRDYLRRRGWLS